MSDYLTPERTAGLAPAIVTNAALTFSTLPKPVQFDTLTLAESKALIALPAGFQEELSDNRRLYYGDHWLDGRGWVGPWPVVDAGMSKEDAATIYVLHQEIRRGFTPRNAIAECDDRHTTGVVGTEPSWSWTADGIRVQTPANRVSAPLPTPPAPRDPNAGSLDAERPSSEPSGSDVPDDVVPGETPEDKAIRERIDKQNARLVKWWDDKGVATHLQSFVRSMLYGRAASLSLYIPPSALQADVASGRRTLTVKDIDDALSKIHVEVLDADVGRVVRTQDTLAEIGVKVVKMGEQESGHATFVDPASGNTVLLVFTDREKPTRLDFKIGGRLLMHTEVRDAFTTEGVRRSQYALNYANSVIPRNLTTAGFSRTILTNAHVNGHSETRNGHKVFVADPVPQGPGITTVFQGHELEDANGNTSMTPVGVYEQQPISPDGTIKAKREHYQDILEECNQSHILIAGDAVASAVSRIQARADHLASMGLTKARVERAGRWLLETATAWAAALAGGSGADGAAEIEGLRMRFSCYLDAGPLDATERAQNTADVAAGTLSVETAIERNNIADSDAEMERIRQWRSLDLEVKRATIFQAWVTAGADEAFAAWRAGLTTTEARRLASAFTPPAKPASPGAPGAPGTEGTPPAGGNASGNGTGAPPRAGTNGNGNGTPPRVPPPAPRQGAA